MTSRPFDTAAKACRVRRAVAADAASINRIYNHYVECSHITFDTDPWSLENRIDWIDSFAEGAGHHHLLVATVDEEAIGFCCNTAFRPKPAYIQSTETTIYGDPHSYHPGMGTALYDALFSLITHSPLHRAYAVIALPNDESIRFHQKFGFAPCGSLGEVGRKFGRYIDVMLMEKPL